MTILLLLGESFLTALLIMPALLIVFYGFNITNIKWRKCLTVFLMLLIILFIINYVGSLNLKSAFIGLFTITKNVWAIVISYLIVIGIQKIFGRFMNPNK